MRLKPQDLEKITDLTLRHYNEYAEYFWEGTRDHNVSQNIAALLQSIEGEPPYTILDFGCGPIIGYVVTRRLEEKPRARCCGFYKPSFSATIFSTLKIAVELANAVSASYAMASNGLCR
jgi:hypothetical protein